MLTRCLPSSGRIVAAQFSVLMTFPCTLIIYKLLPLTAAGGMSTMMAPYACVFFVSGCLISWWDATLPFSQPVWSFIPSLSPVAACFLPVMKTDAWPPRCIHVEVKSHIMM